MKIILLYLVTLLTSLQMYSQVDTSRFESLARYCILRYSIERNFEGMQWNNRDWIDARLHEIRNIIQADSFQYKIEFLGRYERFLFLVVIDHTNFQLHGFNYNVFAVDTTDDISSYYHLNPDNLLGFINTYLYEFAVDSVMRTNLIGIYDRAMFYMKSHYYYSINPISVDEISNEIQEIGGFLYDYRFEKLGDKLCQKRLYKMREYDGMVQDLIESTYFFERDSLHVEDRLLLRMNGQGHS